jgi:hypothetical protein
VASFEHSSEAAVRGFCTFLVAGAIFEAGAGVAGAAVWANAVPPSSRDAAMIAMKREDVVMEIPQVDEGFNVAESG